jgi:hypothetical protein
MKYYATTVTIKILHEADEEISVSERAENFLDLLTGDYRQATTPEPLTPIELKQICDEWDIDMSLLDLEEPEQEVARFGGSPGWDQNIILLVNDPEDGTVIDMGSATNESDRIRITLQEAKEYVTNLTKAIAIAESK